MKLYFTDNIWAKASGGTFAFIPNLDIIIHNKISPMPGWILNMTGGEFAAQFAVRFVSTILLAIVGGLFGLVGKELYIHIVQPSFKRWLKKRNHGNKNIN